MRIPNADVEAARIAIASRGGDPEQLFALARRLRDQNRIGYARRVLQAALETPEAAGVAHRLEMRVDLAFCTFKDPDLPLASRLETATLMLRQALDDCPPGSALRQECFGISGDVECQRWYAYGSKSHLEAARDCYLAAMQSGIEPDRGQSAVNAALTLDLLGDTQRAAEVRGAAVAVLARLDPAEYAVCANLGECYLGSGDYAAARRWMLAAAGFQVPGWQLEATARRVAQLVRLGRPGPDLDAVLPALLGGDALFAESFVRGKVGLALSGGGFRASLFHIGVFARLAELDMLRHVEVISCVSGGSILGAYYYLELKRLLESKPDAEITREDYIELVGRMERQFLAGVQRNIRTRMLLGFRGNLRVLCSRNVSNSDLLGDLYERELYARIEDGHRGPRYLRDLLVTPHGCADFQPKSGNWRRRAKVPILILNATTLNTCHNWQFTATFMGEPPSRGMDTAIEANPRLRRMYHEEAPLEWRNVRLGQAVAASACVPGLFDPVAMERLYPGFTTRLVDGGVYDNQGVASLLEQDCSVLLVSDASGQTGAEADPPAGHLGVPARANSILMARVRESQVQLLSHLRDSGVLQGLMFVHLKKGLSGGTVDWLDCPDPADPQPAPPLTRHGVRRDVQALLAGVRTDLDSFGDCEADALMFSAYAMTAAEFPRGVPAFPAEGPEAPWRFRAIQSIAGQPGGAPEVTALKSALRVAASRSFKAYRVSRGLAALAVIAGIAAAAAVAAGISAFWSEPALTLGHAVLAAAVLALLWAAGKVLHRSPGRALVSLVMCATGWLFLWVHLRFIDPLYIRCGPKYRTKEEPEERASPAR